MTVKRIKYLETIKDGCQFCGVTIAGVGVGEGRVEIVGDIREYKMVFRLESFFK